MLSEKLKPVKLLAPAADRFNTNPATDVVNLGLGEILTAFVIHQGGTTGKATITVEACTAADGTGATAIAYRYRRIATGADDTLGTISSATSAGIDTVPTEDTAIEVSIRADELPSGYPFVRLKLTEAVNDPVNGCVIGFVSEPRYTGSGAPTVLA